MHTTPKLSVLIPTFNRENLVGQAIDSVLNQAFSDFEIICTDNASEDKTWDVLQAYAAKDSRIKVFRNDTNLGPVGNWKASLNRASGEYVHWLWSDDWIEADFYTDAFSTMQEDGTQVLSTWNYRSDNPNDFDEKYISWRFSLPTVPGVVAAKKLLLLQTELPASPAAYILPTNLVRKYFCDDIFKLDDKIDPVRKGVGVDSLMIVGCAMNVEKVSILRKPSVVFRAHDNLSVNLAREGTLTKMYLLAHIWFIAQHGPKLNPKEYLALTYKAFRVLKTSFWNPKVLKLTLTCLLRLSLLSGKYNSFCYKSDKAFFKS